MAANNWLSERRTEVAADRILDAAEELFTRHDPGSVGMNEIAKAAGCSRATLYRYFDNREALRNAYVHRETHRLSEAIDERIRGIEDPRDRLVAGIVTTLRLVRQSPALSAWFATTAPPIGAEDVQIDGEQTAVRPALVGMNRPANSTGLPAISVPCGFTRRGLPIGLQLIGRAFDETTLLRIAYSYERSHEWAARHPHLDFK